MDLEALALFHTVASHGGFGRAARATGQSKTTLSRRVADLEAALGLRLFERGGTRLWLTQEGRELLASTQEPLDELAAAEQVLRSGGSAEPRGRLRVSVPLMFGEQVIAPFAAKFVARYPLVQLEVIADDRFVDAVEEGFHVVIRAGPQPSEGLVGRPILRDRIVVIAPPDWTRPNAAADGAPLAIRAVVRAVGATHPRWIVENDDGRRMVIEPQPVLRLSTLIIRDAVSAGAGVALFPSFFVRQDIAAGRLVCWGTLVAEPLEFWALHASSRLTSRKVRAFLEMLGESMDAAAAKGAYPRG